MIFIIDLSGFCQKVLPSPSVYKLSSRILCQPTQTYTCYSICTRWGSRNTNEVTFANTQWLICAVRGRTIPSVEYLKSNRTGRTCFSYKHLSSQRRFLSAQSLLNVRVYSCKMHLNNWIVTISKCRGLAYCRYSSANNSFEIEVSRALFVQTRVIVNVIQI